MPESYCFCKGPFYFYFFLYILFFKFFQFFLIYFISFNFSDSVILINQKDPKLITHPLNFQIDVIFFLCEIDVILIFEVSKFSSISDPPSRIYFLNFFMEIFLKKVLAGCMVNISNNQSCVICVEIMPHVAHYFLFLFYYNSIVIVLYKPRRSNINPKCFENTKICQLLTLHIFPLSTNISLNFEGVS